ncbi:MAG: isochorismatase family protein [Cyanobacteria bacterium REEB67]|nr:isochorismatase family protein [Cyanobacteria bacterium REEB67]
MKVTKSLVIVDMQPELPASRPAWLRQAVLEQIVRARASNMAIIVLEYLSREPLRFYGETYNELIAAARGHSHFTMRAKATPDGSEAVAAACQAMALEDQDFVVCGINTHACVEATVTGLLKLFPASRIEVVADACNDYRGNDWSQFPQQENLTINHT